MTVGQVKARIDAGVVDIDAALGILVKVADAVDDALGGARHTTHDSQHSKVIAALAKLRQATADADRIAALLRDAVRGARAYSGTLG